MKKLVEVSVDFDKIPEGVCDEFLTKIENLAKEYECEVKIGLGLEYEAE